MTLIHWQILCAFLFSTGLYGFLSRRGAVSVLISIELMLNAAAVNFVVFNRFVAPAKMDGQIMAIFILALAAADVLVALSIFVMLFRIKRSSDVSELAQLKN
jgi:NADH:ubiquinone oxidoreductase subunit K